MSRLKNYGLWVAIAALGGMIVQDAGLLALTDYEKYVDAVLSIAVIAGIINNPSNGSGYKDE